MAVKYTCPECASVLRPAKPVAPGKKIKCPECGCVFAPAASAEKPTPTKTPAKATATEEDDDPNLYGLASEPKPSGDEDKRALHFGSLRDKYPKSKRGPAMAAVVRPANTIMLMGAVLCVVSIVGAIWAIFPMVFTEKALPGDRMREQFLYLGGAIFAFAWGATVCTGASKMQYLESYKWAMAGSIMSVPLLAGIWGIVVLRDEKVIAGFEEGIPPTR